MHCDKAYILNILEAAKLDVTYVEDKTKEAVSETGNGRYPQPRRM